MKWFKRELILHTQDKEITSVIEWINRIRNETGKYITFEWEYRPNKPIEYRLYISEIGYKRLNNIHDLIKILDSLELFIKLDSNW